jgi:hypothetical protein
MIDFLLKTEKYVDIDCLFSVFTYLLVFIHLKSAQQLFKKKI